LKRIIANAPATRMTPTPAPTPIPAAAPGVIAEDEDDEAKDVFELGTEVALDIGVEYVADPVIGS
jgi:hypothetical protein